MGSLKLFNLKTVSAFILGLITLTLPVSAFDSGNYKNIIEKSPDSNFVFLFAFRSATYLDWSTPSNLAKTTLKSQIMKKLNEDASSIGHAQIAWYCNDGNGKIVSGATGQTGQNGNEGTKLILDGWGLSILDIVYTDGSLETPKQVEDKMFKADRNNNFSWMALKVDQKSCLGMSDFAEAYRKSGAEVNYGFPVDPLKFEGAGCTSFANAAFYKTSLNLPLSKAWVRNIKIPLRHMGKLSQPLPGTRPLELVKTKEQEKKVPITDFIFGDVKWAQSGEEFKDFNYYDPELFYESMIHLENKYREQAGIKLKNPVRTKEYDETQFNTKNISELWFDDLIQNNKIIKMGKIHSTTGLIINLN